MKREEITALFPDATKEQIDSLMNINGTDINNAKKENLDPKELKRLQDIEMEYSKLSDANLTDAEKIKKALEDAENSKIEFAKKSNRLDVEKIFVAAGLTQEDYKDYIDDLVSDNSEISTKLANGFVSTLSKQKESAIAKFKEDNLDNTPNPGGGKGGENKTEDVKFAETLAETMKNGETNSKSVFENY